MEISEPDQQKFYKVLEELETLPKYQQIMIFKLILEDWRLKEIHELFQSKSKQGDTES